MVESLSKKSKRKKKKKKKKKKKTHMTQSDERDTQPSVRDVALIVGGGPGISASCARLFAESGIRVGIAARNPDKSVLTNLEKTHGVRRYACDASEPAAVELLFQKVVRDLGVPTLVVHNIDGRMAGIFRKGIIEADPTMALDTLRNSAFSAFLVGQQAALLMRENETRRQRQEGNDHFHERKRTVARPAPFVIASGRSPRSRTADCGHRGTKNRRSP